jgi:hypothetical protein
MLFAGALALVLAMLPGLAQALQKPFGDLAALDDQRLDQLRGGLDAGTGLMVSFGFERVVSVNGEAVARQLLVINDLASLLQGTVPNLQVVANLGQVVQNGPGNFVGSSAVADEHAEARQPTPAATPNAMTPAATPNVTIPAATPNATTPGVPPNAATQPTAATSGPAANTAAVVPAATPSAAPAAAAAPPTAAAPNAAPAGTPVSASAAPAPSTAPTATAAAPVAAPAPASSTQPLTIRTPTGTVTLNLPNTALIVQNTLNNTSIQVNTALSAALNSASLARALVLSGQVRAP